jgi:hypothetical protein
MNTLVKQSLMPLVLSTFLQQISFINRWDSLSLLSLLGIYVSIFNLMSCAMIINRMYLIEEAKKAEAEAQDDTDYSDMPGLVPIVPSCSHSFKLNDNMIRHRVKEAQKEYIKKIYPNLQKLVNDTNQRNFQNEPVKEDVILRRSTRILNKSQKEA